jgi:putative SOS response-associated peptidase YedK
MCGRTALTASPEDLKEAFALVEEPAHTPSYNVPPSRPVRGVRAMRGGDGPPQRRRLETFRWGLVPFWADDAKIGHRLALARVETVLESRAFRESMLERRCLVAVDVFYEWLHHGKKGGRPFAVRRPDGKPFALGGIWDRWVSSDGEVIESCAILTQPARPPVDRVHDRMPLVIEPAEWDRWLDPGLIDPDEVSRLLEPREPELSAYEVSPYVNDPRHDDARCLEAATVRQQSLF